ncbi:putative RPR [Lyophyllum shimeji]|uniref:RPR n=1 Tax=Lyophyllum shimeji TaxID=47721 RepID=A0A9P3PEC5_LYOSH|nr:putative RPR [Lyophyllum shimeji]
MSLYSAHSHYGQPPYSHYSQPAAHSGYHYQYQQPPPPIPPAPVYLDPVSFRREYTSRLAELTVNSRPVIQHLSMLAQDYSRYAEIVAQCVESHIRRVPPWMKLPAFYLLDAISKNVYEPYARHFAAFVIPLFLETYGQVDENTRSKMEEMLLTWRTGSPHGKELFGVPPQVAIERGVWGDGGSSHSMSSFHSGSGHITKAQVLSELEFTLGQKERALQANPYDAASQNHVNVLHQLRKLVEAGVSQEELQQILTQLRSLVRSTAPPPPPPPAAPPAQWQPQPIYPAQPSNQPSFPPAPSYPTDGVQVEAPPSIVPASTATPTPAVAPPADIANLLSTLLKAGVVSASGTPVGAGATSKEEAAKQQIVENDGLEREASRAYRQAILSQPIKLTTSDITRKRPHIVEFLYNQLTAQCKQCGIRFADTIIGKKHMEDHLDMHFRQNRKANQNIGRGHSRSWFIGVEDWVHDISDAKGKDRADSALRRNPKAAAAAEVAKRDAELRAMFVVVPPGDEAKPVSCPICKEILKSEFLEEDEDWVWKNVVKKDDRVYHATCHAEAVASTSSLAARLRSELATGRSGSATPEAPSLRSTPPPSTMRDSKSKSPSLSPSREAKLAGTKRKVGENDSTYPGEDGGTPPMKKLALSPLPATS